MSRFNQLYALVREIEAATARQAQADQQARREVVRRPIPGRLGTVTVSAEAGLISVELDKRALRYTSAAALGPAVRQAIAEAEAGIAAGYQQRLAEARHG